MEKTLLHSLVHQSMALALEAKALEAKAAALVNLAESMVAQNDQRTFCEIGDPHMWEEGPVNYRCRICGQLRFKDDGSTGQDAGVAGGQADDQDQEP